MDANFIPKLLELTEKYRAAEDLKVSLEDGAVLVRCDKGSFRFFYDFNMEPRDDCYTPVPLFHWQAQPKYLQLRGLIDRGMVEPAPAMRIHHMVSHDAFTRTLKDIVVFEANLFEFITRSTIDHVFADFSGMVYTNYIMSTKNNLKASMELGFLPDGSEPVLLHEVVARSGIASDLPVDIQTVQYPIYVFKGEKTETYNEIDYELYGMNNTEADCIRFILWALTDSTRIQQLQADYAHLEKVWEAAEKASAVLSNTEVEGCENETGQSCDSISYSCPCP